MWQLISPIGGRVVSQVTQRQPNDKEVKTGKVSPQKEDDRHVFVTVETTWLNEVGDLETANVTGPAIILNYPPKDWSRYGRSEERRVGKECRAGWSAEE